MQILGLQGHLNCFPNYPTVSPNLSISFWIVAGCSTWGNSFSPPKGSQLMAHKRGTFVAMNVGWHAKQGKQCGQTLDDCSWYIRAWEPKRKSGALINYVKKIVTVVSIVAWQRALEVNIDSFKWLSSLDEWDPLRLVILRLEFWANRILICNPFYIILRVRQVLWAYKVVEPCDTWMA